MEEAIKEKIRKLQLIEENLHTYLGQKQQVQGQVMEIESATAALESANSFYKIIGNIMVEQPEVDLRKELGERLELVKVRLAALERQEERLKGQAESLQQEIMKSMKGDGHGEL
jgi:prefoldin beta subunit